MKRRLTPVEIDDILSVFDDLYLGLDPVTRAETVGRLKTRIREQLERVEMNPDFVYKMRGELARMYRPVEPGKAVGIITAQSVGEMQTQMNLNVFHRAGYRDRQTENSSRLQELTCTIKTKSQHSVSMAIRFKPGAATREDMLRALVFKTLSSYTLAYRRCAETADWERDFVAHFGRAPPAAPKYRLEMNLEDMYRFRLPLEEMASAVEARVPGVEVFFSPLHAGQLCVFASPGQLKECLAVDLHGIEGIQHAYFLPQRLGSTDLFIETEGSHLERVLSLSFVDAFETMTNDMWEIYKLFGIEAVRQFLVEELQTIMAGVHFGHAEFLADRMTVSGHLKSITRYTRKAENRASVLSKITFEETMKRATEAALQEKVDNVRGCSASVIVGKPPSTGSGLNQLVFKFLEE